MAAPLPLPLRPVRKFQVWDLELRALPPLPLLPPPPLAALLQVAA